MRGNSVVCNFILICNLGEVQFLCDKQSKRGHIARLCVCRQIEMHSSESGQYLLSKPCVCSEPDMIEVLMWLKTPFIYSFICTYIQNQVYHYIFLFKHCCCITA